MYKRALSLMLLVHLIFLFGFLCVRGVTVNRLSAASLDIIGADRQVTVTKKEASTLGIVGSAVSKQRVINVSELEKKSDREYVYELSEEDLDILLRIVEAEAGNQDIEGKILVANVVLNRVENEKFPDNVTDVVLQKNKGKYQFSPVKSGRIWKVEVSDSTSEAVDRVLRGEDISEGALYFAARKYANESSMKWFDNHLTFLFHHGGHEFYR